MSAGTNGVVGGIRIDLKQLHETWMEIVYPRQRNASDTVLGRWTPDTSLGMALYRLWSVLGVPVVGIVYPLVLLGTFVRFQTRRISGTARRLGVVGVVVLSVLAWGSLTALARFEPGQFDLMSGGFVAVAVAGGVATVCSALAVGTRAIGGRATTVLLSYPFAMTALFLPPVVAALYSTAVADVVLTGSDTVARWFLFDLLGESNPVTEFFVRNFTREGFAYVLMWLGVTVPLGWILGSLVTLADLVRPTE